MNAQLGTQMQPNSLIHTIINGLTIATSTVFVVIAVVVVITVGGAITAAGAATIIRAAAKADSVQTKRDVPACRLL